VTSRGSSLLFYSFVPHTYGICRTLCLCSNDGNQRLRPSHFESQSIPSHLGFTLVIIHGTHGNNRGPELVYKCAAWGAASDGSAIMNVRNHGSHLIFFSTMHRYLMNDGPWNRSVIWTDRPINRPLEWFITEGRWG